MKSAFVLALLASVSAIKLTQSPLPNTCVNANKATTEDEPCHTPGNSAWNTITTSRTGNPENAVAAPYPGHTLH